VPSPIAPYAEDRENEARRGKRVGRTAAEGGNAMSDWTTFDFCMAEHGAQTARVNQDAWRRQGPTRHQGASRSPRRVVAAVALGLGLLTGLVLGQARHEAQAAAAPMSSTPIVLDWEGQERGQVAPASVPDQFTYREDHRAGITAPTGTLSGGSYADTVWELDQAIWAATNGPAGVAAGGTLSGGSYADTIWELEQAMRGLELAARPVRPVDASIATDYRWDFGASAGSGVPDLLPGAGPMVYA
jgi:hypothetical protein